MHKVYIFACCAASMSFVLSFHINFTKTSNDIHLINRTSLRTTLEKVVSEILNKSKSISNEKKDFSDFNVKSHKTDKHKNITQLELGHKQYFKDNNVVAKHKNGSMEQKDHHLKNTQNSLPFLHRIHARVTRSKDAIWATVTLTFICVLLVLAVAQSRMWREHYYVEAQGVPLPNFNEKVLFKDVMDRKVKLLKQLFKKKSKKENVTELESLLPTSEWDE